MSEIGLPGTFRWNVLVTLHIVGGPTCDVYVPIDDEDDLLISARSDRAEQAALDALRPFLNNRVHFTASTSLPSGCAMKVPPTRSPGVSDD